LQEYQDSANPAPTLAEAHTIPATAYGSHEFFEFEQLNIFAKSWQAVGRMDQLRSVGNFFTSSLGHTPIVVVRNQSEMLSGFVNVCRHRAARVEVRDSGKAKSFRCRYHGWAYDLTGQLAGAPEFQGACDFNIKEICLPKIRVAPLGPILMACLDNDCDDLEFSDVAEKIESQGGKSMHFAMRKQYEIQCNWKVFVDNFLDGGYHVPTLHGELATALNMDEYDTRVFERASVQIAPLKVQTKNKGIYDVRRGSEAYFWWLFPNFMINIYQDTMDTNLIIPLGSDRCLCIFDFYFQNAEPSNKEFISESVALADRVQQEDVEICEEVQRGLSSGGFDVGRYSPRREAGVFHFHSLLRQLGGPYAKI
jgi:choline monooxygenase